MTDATDDRSIAADLAVIGFGKGAKTLAATLGRKGKRVVMIEQSAQMYGGTCINIGCVPTKSLVYQAEQLSERNPAAYRRAVENELALTAKLRADNFAMLDGIESVSVLTGRAEFVDPHTVKVTLVDGGGTIVVSAEHLVVSTGSEPRIPDVPGLEDSGVMVTSTDLLATPELPRRLVVLGGGYVGWSSRPCMPPTARRSRCSNATPKSSARRTTTSPPAPGTCCARTASPSLPTPRSTR